MLPWTPALTYTNATGAATTLTLQWPARPFSPVEGGIGGHEWSAAGVPAGYVVREDSDLAVPLRFTEGEWPAVRLFLRAVARGAQFTWTPDRNRAATTHTCYLVAPVAGEEIRPTRSAEYPSVFELTVTLRQTGGVAWDLRYIEGAA